MPSPRQGISDLPAICLQHGIKHVIIAPGSRNAPLVMAFARNADFNCLSITDERCAGYYALGMAIFLQKPVAVICTSGTAAVNLYPAISEAYYLRVPMLVLTADRPPELIDQNDGQTIRQSNIYAPMVKKSFVLPVETSDENDLWYFRRTISEAINLSFEGVPGPVHINVPLRTPLYAKLPESEPPKAPIQLLKSKTSLSPEKLKILAERWQQSRKRLVVCGQAAKNDKLNQSLEYIAKNNLAVVVAENLSNLASPYFIDTPEQFIASLSDDEKMAFAPDLLITIGSSVVSKRLKKFIRQHKPAQHWHVDEHQFYIDTYQSLTLNVACSSEEFFSNMRSVDAANPNYSRIYTQRQSQILKNLDEFVREAPFTDLVAFSSIISHIPDNYALHLANSTPVRYSQLFDSRKSITYHSNRGTSGIDGCISTAAGYALASGSENLLITGDLAFIYDSNALWNNKFPANLKIIVFENGGGNIFKLIETSPEVEGIEHFFETPHRVNIALLASAYGFEHKVATTAKELNTILAELFKPNTTPIVISVTTSGLESANVYKSYFKLISSKQWESRENGLL